MALSKEERELERARKAYEWGYADGQKGRHSLVNHVNVSAA